MKKTTLIEIILGTVGGLVASIGMCMYLIEEWNMLVQGITVGIIGIIILLSIIPVYRKEHPPQHKEVNKGLIAVIITGIVGALIMGFGMSKTMIDGTSQPEMIFGMITGIIGLLICVLNYPIYAYIKK